MLDLTIATLILVSSIWGTHHFYKIVQLEEQDEGSQLSYPLASGISRFDILSENRCIGSVNVEITKDRSTVVKAQANMRVAVGSKKDELSGSLHAEFNPLSQLIISQANLKFADLKLSLATKYAKPIKVFLTATGPEINRTLSNEINGPILLEEAKSGEFHLSSPGMRTENLGILRAPLAHFGQDLKLSIVPILKEQQFCAAKNPGELQLGTAIKKMQGLIPFADGLFGAGR